MQPRPETIENRALEKMKRSHRKPFLWKRLALYVCAYLERCLSHPARRNHRILQGFRFNPLGFNGFWAKVWDIVSARKGKGLSKRLQRRCLDREHGLDGLVLLLRAAWGLGGGGEPHAYVCIYLNLSKHVYVHTHTYIHTYMHACMHACIHTYIHTCMCVPCYRHHRVNLVYY